MRRSHLVVGILCLLLGAVTAFLYSSGKGGKNLVTANDSPVTVRGGSVLVRSGSWTKVSNTVFQAATDTSSVLTDTSSVSLDGVIQSGGTAPSDYTQSSLTNNWQLTLNFRLHDGKRDDADGNLTKLFLCSKLNNAKTACDPTGPLSRGNLFLVTESQAGGTFNDDLQLDGYYRERYDVQVCDNNTESNNARDSKCNHIFDIKVDGIPAWAGDSPFQCLAGACDIGVGPPGTAITGR